MQLLHRIQFYRFQMLKFFLRSGNLSFVKKKIPPEIKSGEHDGCFMVFTWFLVKNLASSEFDEIAHYHHVKPINYSTTILAICDVQHPLKSSKRTGSIPY